MAEGVTLQQIEALYREHEELVGMIARGLIKKIKLAIDFSDLMSAGREGLLDAARRFSPEKQIPFRAYASIRVRGAMLDEARRLSPLPRRTYERLLAAEAAQQYSEGAAEEVFSARQGPKLDKEQSGQIISNYIAGLTTAAVLGLVVRSTVGEAGENIAIDPTRSAEQQLCRQVVHRTLKSKLAELPEQERTLLFRHYFLGERFDCVAKELGISKSWASRIHQRALRLLSEQIDPPTLL